ncbi:MAG: GntR family transcriptional regulator [Planctomycetes bacterium]|nr:GntR family transcriptional regulator [Planctomycetota bacterium]
MSIKTKVPAYKPRFADAFSWSLDLKRDDPDAPPLVEQLREGIRAVILAGRLKPGQALLPQRQLCKQLGLNQVTVTRALQDLVRDGLLRSEKGRGLFVSDLRPPRLTILCRSRSVRQEPGSSYARIVSGALKRLERQNVRVNWVVRERGTEGDRFGPGLDRVSAEDADAFLAVGIQNEEYLAAVVALGRPVVALDAAPTTAEFDAVVQDTFREGYLATRRLLEFGHRAILYLGAHRGDHPAPLSPDARIPEPDSFKREAGYRFALAEAGVAYRPEWSVQRTQNDAAAQAQVAQLLARGEVTAAAAWGSWAAWLAKQAEIPERLSYVGFGPAEALPKATCLDADVEALARAVALRVLRRLRREEPEEGERRPAAHGVLSTVAPVWTEGSSVKRIGESPEVYRYHARQQQAEFSEKNAEE